MKAGRLYSLPPTVPPPMGPARKPSRKPFLSAALLKYPSSGSAHCAAAKVAGRTMSTRKISRLESLAASTVVRYWFWASLVAPPVSSLILMSGLAFSNLANSGLKISGRCCDPMNIVRVVAAWALERVRVTRVKSVVNRLSVRGFINPPGS